MVLSSNLDGKTRELRADISRRQFVRTGVALLAAGSTTSILQRCWAVEPNSIAGGAIRGEPSAERVASRVLADGGNVVDAIVAGALTAAVSSIHQTGIGGYGGALVVAMDRGKKIATIDFNTAAPLALTDDFFQSDASRPAADRKQRHGWLSAGVPGILAGLQLALDRYGSRSFGELVRPAITIAREGFVLPASLAQIIKNQSANLAKDPASANLYLRDGKPPATGEVFRNPELADMLETLAERNSVESFYRGDIGQHIAEAFQRNGGLVTYQDMTAYAAKEISPLSMTWDGLTMHTAPLTAGGLTVLQALQILKMMNWPAGLAPIESTQSRIESLRKAWQDRLLLLGDPDQAKVPVEKLVSLTYATEVAQHIRSAVKAAQVVDWQTTARTQNGTIHLSAADQAGNLAALTFTHGDSFGSQVTVEGLGLTLGHGMSRFEAAPGHPNSPGPDKRPLHNMCPTIVVLDGQPILALGGRGGRKIPNAVFEVLLQYSAFRKISEAAVASPRLHTEGGIEVTFEKNWPVTELEACRRMGYKAIVGTSATISAASFDPRTGECRAALR